MADNVVESIFVKLGLDASGYNTGAEKAIKQNDKLNKSTEKADKNIAALGKTIAKVFGAAAAFVGLKSLIDEVQRLNDELYHLEKNLGMSATTIKSWQGAAAAMGGSADGMTSSMKSLNMAMNDFVMMGDTSMLPYMNALGVAMVDTNGKIRDTDKVMLDLADSFSKMDREQAFSLASKMGIDEGTFNTLVQGREEMEKMIEYQKTIYKSSEQELKVSRELAKNRALLGTHWESLKTMFANAIMPLLVKVSEVLLGMFDYLQKHQRTVQAVIKGIAFAIGVVLIPVMTKAALAATAMLLPFAPLIATVTALGVAFGLLYDDYETWARGGKSLFDWGAFTGYIDKSKLSVDNLGTAFKNLGKDILNSAIPTLKGYAEIVQKLINRDFVGAGKQALGMLVNLGERTGDVIDDLTGNKQGTFIESGRKFLFNDDKNVKQSTTVVAPSKKYGSSLQLSEQDIVDIMKVASTEVVPSLKGKNFEQQAAGVVDTILNRAASGKYGDGVRGVANQRWAFSDINTPRKSAYGSVQNVPMSRVSPKMEAFVRDYLAKRAAGMPSSVGENVSYANPNYLGEASASTKAWVAEVEKQARASGQVFGAGKAIHVHGTPSADRNKMPSPFNVVLPNQAAIAQQSMRQNTGIPMRSASNTTKTSKVDVQVGDINVNTSSSTVTGTTTDAMTAVKTQVFQWFSAID